MEDSPSLASFGLLIQDKLLLNLFNVLSTKVCDGIFSIHTEKPVT